MSPATARADTEQTSPQDRLAVLTAQYGHLGGVDLLRAMLDGPFKGRIAMVSSFGAEAVVLLHMVSQIDPATPVIFLDTGKLFGETLRYRDAVRDRLGLTNILTIDPDPAEIAAEDKLGLLWHHNPDACCALRKTRPLNRALEPFEAWVTGRKRFQASTRTALPALEYAGGKFKINPLADWTSEQLEAYIAAHDLPRHPLVADGYPSIGCMPCTARVAPGGDARSGRWAGQNKTECGIHTGEGI